jgi:hypothetical protein
MAVLVANKPLSAYMTATGRGFTELHPYDTKGVAGGRLLKMGRVSSRESTTTAAGWRGHMVVGVGGQYFLDLTVDSLNDPADGFSGLTPYWLSVGKDTLWQLEHTSGELIVPMGDGLNATYYGDAENRAYEKMEAWTVWSGFHERLITRFRQEFSTHTLGR